ncbi:MAG TPA: hypothetical protein VH325_00925 [Bryobacteraceae bacterium]|nr:hypothetical protein [Bryobacteraceae bacterium]
MINHAETAFGAEDNPASAAVRGSLLNGCWNDEAIAQVAFACGRADRTAWRNRTIEDALSATQAWRRLKGLTLASFFDLQPEEFEALVARVNVTGRWVDESLRELGATVRRNHIARHFFFKFLEAESDDEAWAALNISLSLTDERLLKWRSDAQTTRTEPPVVRRLHFLDLWAGGQNLDQEVCRESKRRKTFLGLEIMSGEIMPFM